MAVITLTTDWKTGDYYSGMMRGRLLRLIPGSVIADISQDIDSFHIVQASFILRQVIGEYPDGSVHLVLVNRGHREGVWPAVALHRKQYLIGWDEEVLGMVVEGEPDYYLRVDSEVLEQMDRMFPVDPSFRLIDPSFPELSIFTRIAYFLASGGTLDQCGPSEVEVDRSNPWLPVIHKDQIDGRVILIDAYGNAITNIPKAEYARIGSDRNFEITIKSNRYKVNYINSIYMESDPGELLAIFNSAGLLEIAVAQGNSAELFGFEPGTPIKIKFDEQRP